MSIRDVVLTAVIFGLLPVCFRRPWIGGLVWTWFGLMNPHKLVWGFAGRIPFALLIAAATLAGLALTTERRPVPRGRDTTLLAALWGLFLVSTVFAWYPAAAWTYFAQVCKILLMTFVLLMLFQDRERLRWLLLVAALSIGFYGFKGGIWGAVTGGENRVWGPTNTFIGDNNALALAMNMMIPVLFFLAREEKRRWLQIGLRVVLTVSAFGVLATQSRSGFLGLVVVMFLLTLRMRSKFLVVPAVAVSALLLVVFMPERWSERIRSISDYEEDGSAQARLKAWTVARAIATDSPLLGGGFEAFGMQETWTRYMPEYDKVHNAHSIYFHMLGEHGVTGLVLFLTLIGSVWFTLRGIRRRARRLADGQWFIDYAYMLQVSLAGYLVSGAFINLTYFDLFYLVVGMAIILNQLLKEAIAAEAPPAPPAPAWGSHVTRPPLASPEISPSAGH